MAAVYMGDYLQLSGLKKLQLELTFSVDHVFSQVSDPS